MAKSCVCVASMAAGLMACAAIAVAADPTPVKAVKTDRGKSLPAFPGAEGYGCETPGGRGGKVIYVTNLNPDGPGSLQEACAASGPRIVVFGVSGVIHNTITIEHSNITVAGQTAPGGGITIAGMLVTKEGISDVVIRHIRIRPKTSADTFAGPEGEKVARRMFACYKAGNPGAGEFDLAAVRKEANEYHHAAALNGVKRLVLDHVSFSWGADEVVSLCRSQHVTVQWCMIEEGAIKEGTKYNGIHNFGLFSAYNADGDFISIHHNLFAHNSRRNPSVRDGFADIRNNVSYNFRGGINHDGGGGNNYNYVGNYMKRGPNSTGILPGVSWGKNKFWWAEFQKGHKYFVKDNLLDGKPAPLPATITGGQLALTEPMPAPKVTTHSTAAAYELVLKQAGAFPRDAVTLRTIDEVRTGKGDWGRREPEGGLMAGLKAAQPPKDADRDGMGDEWEKKHGLDPAKDDSAKVMDSGYTAIEVYLDELGRAMVGSR